MVQIISLTLVENMKKSYDEIKIGSIVIACYEFDKMLAFWQEALHYIPRNPAKDGWVVYMILLEYHQIYPLIKFHISAQVKVK